MEALHNGENLDYTGEQWIKFMLDKNQRLQATMSTEGNATNGGFDNKAERIREVLFLPLIPYSDTYQGDEAEW